MTGPSPSLAQRRLEQHEARLGARELSLAAHAALPVVLDPGFVHLLRINFFTEPDALPWLAEVNLLFSPLCSDLGSGMYEIEPGTRALLLERLAAEGGGERMREVASLLWQYVHRRPAPWANEPGLERAQELTALQFLDPEQCEQWLARAETGAGQRGRTDRSWFVAVRRKLEPTLPVVARAQLVEGLRKELAELERICAKTLGRLSRDRARKIVLLFERHAEHVRQFQGMTDEALALVRDDVARLGKAIGPMRLESSLDALQKLGFRPQLETAGEAGWVWPDAYLGTRQTRPLVIHGPPRHGHRWLAARLLAEVEESRRQTIVLSLHEPTTSESDAVVLPQLTTFTSVDLEVWRQRDGLRIGLQALPENLLRETQGIPDAVFEALCRELDLDLADVQRYLGRFDEFVVDERNAALETRAADLLVLVLHRPLLDAVASTSVGWIPDRLPAMGGVRRRRTAGGLELLAVAAPESGRIHDWAARVVSTFRPRALLMVGLAVGMHDYINVGDLVVARQTIHLDGLTDGISEPGHRTVHPCDPGLRSAIQIVFSDDGPQLPTAHFVDVEYGPMSGPLGRSGAKARGVEPDDSALVEVWAQHDLSVALVSSIVGGASPSQHQGSPSSDGIAGLVCFLNAFLERLEPDLTVPPRGTPAKVLVVGTAYHLSPIEVECARALGKRLGEAGHSVVVGGMPGVDYLVASAFADVLGAAGIRLETRLEQVVLENSTPDFGGGSVRHVQTSEAWFATAVTEADAVVIVGGEGATELIYLLARDADVPIFPIAASGRFAATALEQLQRAAISDPSDTAATTPEQLLRSELSARLLQAGPSEAAALIAGHLLTIPKPAINVERRRTNLQPIWIASTCLWPLPIERVDALMSELWQHMTRRHEARLPENRWRIRSPFPADRIVAYVEIQVEPRERDLALVVDALPLERALASEARETRPLFQVLVTLHRIIDEHGVYDGSRVLRGALEATADLLKSRSDLDPGGECKGVLAQLIGRIPHLPPRSLRNRDTGRTFALSFRTTVGRSADCALRLESRQVSGHHAVIRWHDAAWHLRDLGSGNGTWLNGVHIEPGRSHRIDVGDSIRFADDEWRVVDATSPSGSEVH